MRAKVWHKTRKEWVTDKFLLNLKDGKLYKWIPYNIKPVHKLEIKNITVTWAIDKKDMFENFDGITEDEKEGVRRDHVEGDKA